MALSNYGELKSAVANLLNREDLTANIPDWISITTAMINRDTKFRNRLMEASTDLAFTSNEVTLPTDFLEARTAVYLSSPRVRLEYLTPAQFEDIYTSDSSGTPQQFTILGNKLKVGPFPGVGINLRLAYVQKVPALTTDASTNWVLDEHPDVLLYGACVGASPFLGDDQRLQTFFGLYDRAAAELAGIDSRARWNGAPVRPTLSVAIV